MHYPECMKITLKFYSFTNTKPWKRPDEPVQMGHYFHFLKAHILGINSMQRI